MKQYNRIIKLIILVFIVIIAAMNLLVWKGDHSSGNKEYRVAINRIERSIEDFEAENQYGPESLEQLSGFLRDNEKKEVSSYITGLESAQRDGTEMDTLEAWVDTETEDYHLFSTGQYLYKITYRNEYSYRTDLLLYINMILVVLFVLVMIILWYIRNNILKPFHEFVDLPYELSKGNLIKALPENRNRYFGKFFWGMDLLRESLEANKVRELELQKEKKLLLLSLSHDIKTPLSAIKLYAKALSRNLYKDEERKREIAGSIDEKVDEIESYISEIVRASNEDFLHFEVENGEFYLKDVLESIREYYEDKMEMNQIAFGLGEYANCLVYGDKDRLTEVLQNVIENAIKYGDGKRIWLELFREEEEYNIKIYNTGCRLEEKELPHIFDSFFRGSNVEKNPGSGLGLYICRQLMHLMEGEVTASIIPENEECVLMVQVAVRVV